MSACVDEKNMVRAAGSVPRAASESMLNLDRWMDRDNSKEKKDAIDFGRGDYTSIIKRNMEKNK